MIRVKNVVGMFRRDFLALLDLPYVKDDFTKETIARVEVATCDYELRLAQVDFFCYLSKLLCEKLLWNFSCRAYKDFMDDWAPEFFEKDGGT